ncbi:MAG: flagellar M-ring protein FliF [Rhodobacterales bacterium]|nr:flagellar M-ring protein FliF [Rhodobacterales bacterium]
MQNLAAIWSGLDLRRRIILAVATLGVFAAVLGLARVASTPQMALLYGGLDPAAAGEVVAAIEARGLPYQVQGSTILVPADQRDALRLQLAGEGLPAQGAAGYEILEDMTGFGTTAQMFDAAFWRAREGELARTILAMPMVDQARVHLSPRPAQPFQRDNRPTASVTVTLRAGALDAAQARALRHLVAASVAGMAPEDVAVIDSRAGLIPVESAEGGSPLQAQDRAEALKRNAERLLEARVGPGRAVVEVAVELATDRETFSERRIDPQSRVAIATESEERSESATTPDPQVTVASDLPEGDAAGGGGGSSQSAETRERVNFEVSETQREVQRGPGAIRRLTVAVLVDGLPVTAADGTVTIEPRPEAELAALRDLVASAVGLDETRGDVLTLQSMAFSASEPAGTVAAAGLLAGISPMTLIQTLVLALVALVLGLFVVRPLLAARAASAAADLPPLPAPAAPLALPGIDAPRVLSGEIAGDADDALPGRMGLGLDDRADPMERLRRLIAERQAESVEILRGWLDDRAEER